MFFSFARDLIGCSNSRQHDSTNRYVFYTTLVCMIAFCVATAKVKHAKVSGCKLAEFGPKI